MTYYDLNMNSKGITNLTSFSGSNQSIITYGNTTATTAGKLYYLDASNNWIEATNSNSTTRQLAIANGASSSVDGMIISGRITNATYYSAFSVGGALYVSSTSGLMTNTAPSSEIRVLGNSLGSNQIFFSPSNILSVATGMSGYGIASGAGTTGFTQTTITDPSNSLQYSVLKWTDSATTQVNTMSITTAGLFEIFLLGGGGGGGTTSTSGSGGAGGAGELIKQTVYLDTGNWTINVGQGGGSGTAGSGGQSGARGFSSQLVKTTPVLASVTSPKFIATGGGGGMTSSTAQNVPDIQWRLMLLSEGVCCGGGASPYANSSGIVYSNSSGLIGPQTFQNLTGFGQNPSTSLPYGATTGNFLGGLGGNDSNYSASGGGGGLAGAGGDATSTGGASQRGGPSGRGIIDGFSGINIGYGGGGGGGHSTNQGSQITDNTGANVRCILQGFSISGTTLTVTNVERGTISLYMRITGYISGWTSNESFTAPSSEVYISAFGTGSGGNGTYTLSSNAIGNITPSGSYPLMYLSIFGEGQGGRNVDTTNNWYWSGSAGAANSGAGGAGNGNQNNNCGRGGAGGSGVVMVRYRV